MYMLYVTEVEIQKKKKFKKKKEPSVKPKLLKCILNVLFP